MKITIVCVGKLKEAFYKNAVEEYEKRLGAYCKLEIIELPDERTPDSASLAEEKKIKEVEGERILKCLKEDAKIISLAIDGKQFGSEEFAKSINETGIYGTSHIMFIIGGSLGLSEQVGKRSDFMLSFSKMTFPHQLMRVILLEQIYRAFRIIHKEPYHK